jgi:hypothetical protein
MGFTRAQLKELAGFSHVLQLYQFVDKPSSVAIVGYSHDEWSSEFKRAVPDRLGVIFLNNGEGIKVYWENLLGLILASGVVCL